MAVSHMAHTNVGANHIAMTHITSNPIGTQQVIVSNRIPEVTTTNQMQTGSVTFGQNLPDACYGATPRDAVPDLRSNARTDSDVAAIHNSRHHDHRSAEYTTNERNIPN